MLFTKILGLTGRGLKNCWEANMEAIQNSAFLLPSILIGRLESKASVSFHEKEIE